MYRRIKLLRERKGLSLQDVADKSGIAKSTLQRYETGKTKSALSDALAKDLKKRGMTFLGSTIIYSYLQATGFIYAHEKECFLHKGNA